MAQEFSLGKAPNIVITTCHGDLVVKSWEKPEVLVKGQESKTVEMEDGLVIDSNGRLQLFLPEYASLRVESAHGDVVVKNLHGLTSLNDVSGDVVLVNLDQVTLGTVHGDVSAKQINGRITANTISGDAVFRSTGPVSLQQVHGDCAARLVNGDVQLTTVSGGISLRQVNGNVTIQTGHRDANLHFLNGIVNVSNIHGDVRLYGAPGNGAHSCQANGDIIVRWPLNTAVKINAQAREIINRLALDEVNEANGVFSGHSGSGGPVLNLQANGRIILKELHVVSEEWEQYQADDPDLNLTFDLEGLGAQISAQVSEQLSRLSFELKNKFGPEFTQKMAEKIAQRAEQAARRAEEAAERARRRAEKQHGAPFGPRPGRPPMPPVPPRPPKPPKASTEEQLKILKMVEQGIITPEEANTLLEALEHK